MFKGFLKLMEYEFKLFLREPIGAFFTFIFPAFFLFLTMEIFIGRQVVEIVTETGVVEIKIINYVLPNLILMIIATTAFMSLPITVIEYRQTRFFKRLHANPVSPSTVLTALGVAYLVITTFGVIILTIMAFTVYDASFEGNIFTFLLSFMFSYLSIAAISFGLMGSFLRTSRTAVAVGEIIFFPAMFFSGVFVPLEQLPEWLRPISEFIPITHAARLMQGMWQGYPTGDYLKEVAVLAGVLVLGVLVALKKFRWE